MGRNIFTSNFFLSSSKRTSFIERTFLRWKCRECIICVRWNYSDSPYGKHLYDNNVATSNKRSKEMKRSNSVTPHEEKADNASSNSGTKPSQRKNGKVSYKVFKRSYPVTKKKSSSAETSVSKMQITGNNCAEKRVNALGIQMLSPSLYSQLFGINEPSPTEKQIIRAKENLYAHGLLDKPTSSVPDISDLYLPVLKGGTIKSHFQQIGEEQAGPYRSLLENLQINNPPKPPDLWSRMSGWTRYGPEGQMERVDFPDEDSLVFDIEVCRSVGEIPTMATAMSPTHWYSWVCNWLSEDGGNGDPGPPREGKTIVLEELIPLESTSSKVSQKQIDRKRIVVAHHASYDRSRVREQYWPQGTGLRFFDTLSVHVCIGGVSSYQRTVLSADEKKRNRASTKSSSSSDEKLTSEIELDDMAWREVASLNSLAEAHRLHCGGPRIDKKVRDAFSPESPPSEMLTRFQELMTYCSRDTKATHELLCALLPQFLERFPHPVTLAGMLELGTARLPVSHSAWNQYITDASEAHDELESDLKLQLIHRANEKCKLGADGRDDYLRDLWMWDQDWSIQNLEPKKAKVIKKKKNKNDTTQDPVSDFKNFLGVEESEELSEKEMQLSLKFAELVKTAHNLPARRPYMPGYPKWYRQLCPKPSDVDLDEWVPGPTLISPNARVASKLLELCWEKYPLHYIQGYGWGILVPGRPLPDDYDQSVIKEAQPPLEELIRFCPVPMDVKSSFENGSSSITPIQVHRMVEEYMSISEWVSKRKSLKKETNKPPWYEGSGLLCPDVNIPGIWFCRLPHRDGPGKRVGNPLSKDFLEAASHATLSSGDSSGEDLTTKSALTIGKMVSYWRNNRDRIGSQLVVRLPNKGKGLAALERSDDAVILPQVIVCGTLTRRAVEPTWMTASNAESDRVGSELRAMVRPSKSSECMVGADVDSQELWIAALLGDAADSDSSNSDGLSNQSGLHGGTPLGWRTLQGRKSDGTDMHSATAAAVGCSRDQAKVLNYARIYGAGRRFATRLLQRFKPSLTDSEASKKANVMMELTKGKRMRQMLKMEEFEEGRGEENYLWEGGSESAMFNALEKVANMDHPVTPFLHARLSRALEPERVGKRFLTTRVNWVVQSGAVDFLHLLLVAMRSLSPGVSTDSSVSPSLKAKFDVRFALSFHDEVRYIVPQSGRYEAALRLHVAHLLVRAFCSYRAGLGDLPMSVAFFSGVSVDNVMRKEPDDECKTPSNPHGLLRGHGISPGESLDIYTAIKKAQGQYTLAHTQKIHQSKSKKSGKSDNPRELL